MSESIVTFLTNIDRNDIHNMIDKKEDAICITNFADAAVITIEDDAWYRATGDITALTIVLPDAVKVDFRCAIDFGCGDTAAALVYPDTIIWTGDSLDDNALFVPLADHRYHIDIWYDGTYVRANASGVIV